MKVRFFLLTLLGITLTLAAWLSCPDVLMAGERGTVTSRELSPTDKVQVYLEVGTRYQDIRQWEKALKGYEQALDLDPFDVRAHRKMVGLYFDWHAKDPYKVTNREKAVESLYKIQVLDPGAKTSKEMMDWEYKIFVEHVQYLRWWLFYKGGAGPEKSDLLAAEFVLRKNWTWIPKITKFNVNLVSPKPF